MFLNKQHHIAIICSDWAKTKEFYVDRLGFELTREIYRPDEGDYLRFLRKGDTTLEVFIMPDNPERVTNPEAKGLRHLAFYVENIEDAVDWLTKRGVKTEPVMEDKASGGRYVFFKDPDGLPLEFHE